MRVAIYARFSSDLQRDRSVEDQVALCRARALRENWIISHVYEDRARSGASVHGRDGLGALIAAAQSGAFDAVLVESLDRISRDQEDLAGIFKRLKFRGIDLIAAHEGKADQISIGVRGIVGALFLTDLAQKVRRGMAGVIRDGRNAGGRAYGYRPVKGEPGQLAIVPAEADVIRRIFSDYVAGVRPRAIAHALNAEGVPPPRGTYWRASVINGNAKRRDGMLENEIYIGRIVWNRVRMVKDPETGRRVSRVNPEEEWQRADAPQLRIIDDETWTATRAIKGERATVIPQHRRAPKHLLFGLLRCHACGSGLSLTSKNRRKGSTLLPYRRVVCTRAKEAGTCKATQSYDVGAIERAVLAGLRDKLSDRTSIDYHVTVYNKERQRLARTNRKSHSRLADQLAAKEGEVSRLIKLAATGVISEEDAAARIPPARAERDRLREAIAMADRGAEVIALHPKAIEAYLAAVDDLSAAMAAADADQPPIADDQAAAALRHILEKIVVGPKPSREGMPALEIHGYLTALIGADPFASVLASGGCVVAGARSRATPNRSPFIFAA